MCDESLSIDKRKSRKGTSMSTLKCTCVQLGALHFLKNYIIGEYLYGGSMQRFNCRFH